MKEATKTYTSTHSQDSLISTFSDLKKFAELHPIIISASKMKSESNKFTILERPFKYLPFNIKYFAEVYTNHDQVSYDISGIPFTKGKMEYQFISSGKKETQINWKVSIDSKLPIETWLTKKMINAQDKLISKLG